MQDFLRKRGLWKIWKFSLKPNIRTQNFVSVSTKMWPTSDETLIIQLKIKTGTHTYRNVWLKSSQAEIIITNIVIECKDWSCYKIWWELRDISTVLMPMRASCPLKWFFYEYLCLAVILHIHICDFSKYCTFYISDYLTKYLTRFY